MLKETTRDLSSFGIAAQAQFASKQLPWLVSRRIDYWFASGGASVGLLASVLFIILYGDREIDALDLVLSELHLGATYGAIIRRRLWRQRQVDVLLIPLVILMLTYALSRNGQGVLLTSIAMYAAVWHRGRQSLGVARFYQRGTGGPVSWTHEVLFRGAIYLPMLAGMLAYTHLAPTEYEGEPYLALTLGKELTSVVGVVAVIWVIGYLAWVWRKSLGKRSSFANLPIVSLIHPGEWWVVLAHAVAFGSGYVLGASNASFLLVLAVHHEVQYIYFAYAMYRRPPEVRLMNAAKFDPMIKGSESQAVIQTSRPLRTEKEEAASFAVCPIIGFVGAIVGGWSQLTWLAPLGIGGLFCHYWLDGRIWTRRSF